MSDLQTQRVLQLLSEETDAAPIASSWRWIHQSMSLKHDLGLCASQRIAFAFRLEQELGIQLDDSHYDAITNHTATVADVLTAVRCLTSAKETTA